MTKLDQQQLMDIAKELVSKPEEKMPDYLTKQEEETVKELVKTLRASNLAMKTYVQAMVYNDSLRKQIALQNQLASKLKAAIADKQAAATSWNRWMQVQKAVKRNQAKLNASELQAVSDLNDSINDCVWRITKLFYESGIKPNSSWMRQGKEASIQQATLSYLDILSARSNLSFKPDSLVWRASDAEATLSKLQEKLHATNPGLASAAEQMQSKLISARFELMTRYGLADEDVQYSLRTRARMSDRAFRASRRDVELTDTELNKQTKTSETERQQTLAMGNWYIVAALAETFIELGQSLAY